jgi:hypothetical protein
LIPNIHTLLPKDSYFIKYACCIKNYPEQEHFEQEVVDTRTIDMYCQQGDGINLAVCGYSMQHLVMEFQHIGCLEVYGNLPDFVLRDRISFSNGICNVSKFDALLVDQPSLFDGCQFISVEILWKYDPAVLTVNQRERLRQQTKAAKFIGNGVTNANDGGERNCQ